MHSALRAGIVLKTTADWSQSLNLSHAPAPSPVVPRSVVPITNALLWWTDFCRSTLGKRCQGSVGERATFFFLPPRSRQLICVFIFESFLMVFGKMKENNYKWKQESGWAGYKTNTEEEHVVFGWISGWRLFVSLFELIIDFLLEVITPLRRSISLYSLFSVNVPVLFSLPIGMKSARFLPVSLCLSVVMVRSAHKRDWVMSPSAPSLWFSPILWLRQGSQHVCRLWSSGYFISFN